MGARYREQKEVARFKKPQLAVEEQTGKILLHNSKSFSWRSIFRCPSISCTGQQRNSMTDWSELGISRENDHPRFTGVGNFIHFNYIHASVFWNSADLPQSLQLHQLIVYDQERSFYTLNCSIFTIFSFLFRIFGRIFSLVLRFRFWTLAWSQQKTVECLIKALTPSSSWKR